MHPFLTKLEGWNEEWEKEKFPPKNLSLLFPSLESSGIDLLKRMIEPEPKKRITAA